MRTILLIIFLLCVFAGASQQNTISLSINFADVDNSDVVHIQSYLTENDFVSGQSMIDSVEADNVNSISFDIPKDQKPGLLTLYLYVGAKGKSVKAEIDLLFDGSDINLETSLIAPEDSLKDVFGGVNYRYLAFKRQKQFYENYIQLLLQARDKTPENDDFYNALAAGIEKTVDEQKKFFAGVINNSQENAASKLARWELQSVIYNYEKPDAGKLRETYPDRFDFSDPLLQRSKLITTIARSYLFLFANEQLGPEKLQEQAILAISRLMNVVSVNQEVYDKLASKLAEDFMASGLDRVALFIEEAYLSSNQGCKNNRSEIDILADLESLKKVQPGNLAPDFRLENNDSSKLSDIDTKITVVIFWADWCSHCRQVLPGYYEYLKNSENVSVVAIALDTDDHYLEKAINKFPGWMHIQAHGKWEDPLVKKYAVHATPTVYILDTNKNILAKAKTLDELKANLIIPLKQSHSERTKKEL